MKNLIKILLPILALSQSALAAEAGITVKPKGAFDFTFGAINNHGSLGDRKISVNRDRIGFLSQASVTINVENRLSEDLAYGAKLALVTDTRNDRKTPSSIYFESPAGKWELGSDKSATTKMKITGTSNVAATGGTWDVWAKPDIRNNGIQYVTNLGNFVDTKTRNVNDLEYARKITYFTPEMMGFQAGVSYIPDTANIGSNTIKHAPTHLHLVAPGYSFDIKDAIAWGVSQKYKANDDLSFKASVVGEVGKVVPKITDVTKAVAGAKFKKLRTYTVGAEVKYAKFAISGCYSNYMKSLTANGVDDVDRKKTEIYNIGGKYSFDQLSVSLSYLRSNHKKNIVNATTLAADYKLAPGILPYAEVTAFNAKGWYKNAPTATTYTADKHSGWLLLTGVRVEF